MVEELRTVVREKLAEHTPDIVAVVISDKDGVPILQASNDNSPGVDVCLRYHFLSSNAIINDCSKKVMLHGMKKSLTCYNDKQILSIVQGPVILSLIAKANANTGQMEHMAKYLLPMVKEVSKAVLG